jgi:MFS superfamily sulfate permease-like transporter
MIGLRHGKMQDALAGLLLAAIAIPEQLATARLAGMPAEAGLFAFAAGGIGFALFGTNRFLSAGADSTIAPIFAGALLTMAATGSPRYVALVMLLSLMVGAILVLAGLLRAGWVADLLSVPMVTGFLAGVAVHIVVGQLPVVLGVAPPSGPLLSQCVALWDLLPRTNFWALGIAGVVLAITRMSAVWLPKLPGALLALVAVSGAVAAFHPPVDMLTALNPAMPVLAMPSLSDVYHLMPLALIVAVVCMMQTAAVLRAYPSQPEGPLHVARDFAGIGAGNVLAGLAGGFPVNASPPRTAVVAESGGGSQWAGIAAIALAMVLLFWGGGLMAWLPHAALGGILIGVAMHVLRVNEIARIARRGGSEILLVAASAALVVALPIQTGMILGIVLSLLHGFYIVARPRCLILARAVGTTIWWPPHDAPSETVPGVLVFAPAAPINFTNASFIRGELKAAIEKAAAPVKLVVIDASAVIDIDYTGARALADYIVFLRAKGIDLALARLSAERARAQATRTGLLEAFGNDHVFLSVEDAIRGIRK